MYLFAFLFKYSALKKHLYILQIRLKKCIFWNKSKMILIEIFCERQTLALAAAAKSSPLFADKSLTSL